MYIDLKISKQERANFQHMLTRNCVGKYSTSEVCCLHNYTVTIFFIYKDIAVVAKYEYGCAMCNNDDSVIFLLDDHTNSVGILS